jgi:hypothetical protein
MAFSRLRERDITKAVVAFSGGNDEGGADSVTGHKADGSRVSLMNVAFQNWSGAQMDGWVVRAGTEDDRWAVRPATPEEIDDAELADLLEQPVYEEYHTFAGEFEVQGEVIWDVAAATVVMTREESYTSWDTSDKEF